MAKCLCELVLLATVVYHRVRYLWALAFYSFLTTLALMLLAEAKYSHYTEADHWVSMGGGGVMLLVGVGLVQLLRQGRREYGKIMLIYILLCASQVALALVDVRAHPAITNALMQWSWPVFILWLAYECRWLPWLRFNFADLAYMMMKDVRG